MLVLSRKRNESIVINNNIHIIVVEIRGDKVRLGIEAPKEIPVHRREVYEAIKKQEQKDTLSVICADCDTKFKCIPGSNNLKCPTCSPESFV